MQRPVRSSSPGPNRTVFYVIVGLAVSLITCALVTRAVGWTRLCGGGLLLMGAIFLLLAEDKRWPVILLLVGALLMAAEWLLGLAAVAP
jgi:membrane-bound ClpP family serine protease